VLPMLSAASLAARLAAVLLSGLLLPAAPARLAAQQPSAPPQDEVEDVVRVKAELVQTDVMVFDREGKFVDGLKPEQFELKVDGQSQAVAFFERVEAGAVNEDAQLAAARGGVRAAGAAGAAVPLDRGRTVAFFVDDIHLTQQSLPRTRQALLRFVEQEIGQNDVAAVASASGQVGFLQQFTDNKAVLRAAVGRIAPRSENRRDFESPPMSETQAAAVERNDTAVLNVFVEAMLRDTPGLRRDAAVSIVTGRARTIVQRTNQLASATLQSLEAFVRHSAPLPGRKIIFFISEGFVLDVQDGRVRERLRRVTDAAARSNAVIYSMDALGLRTNMPDASETPFFDPTMTLANQALGDVSSYQAPLYTLASETGGRALVNSNALAPGVKGALKETAKYYLLAWRPSGDGAQGGPKYRRVEVAVKGRTDLRVLVRRGFYSTPPADPEQAPEPKKAKGKEKEAAGDAKRLSPALREMRDALFSPHPRTGLPAALSLGYVNTAEDGMVLTSSVELGREAVALLKEVEKDRRRFHLFGVVYDDKGKAVNLFDQDVVFAAPSDGPEAKVVTSTQSKVAPGLYQVRVAVRDPQTGRTGSASEWIEVPDLSKGDLTLSSIFVAERVSGVDTSKLSAEDAEKGVLVSAGRRLARTSWLRFMVYIYGRPAPGAGPDLALQVQVFRDDQPVFTAPLRQVQTEGLSDPTRVPYAAELALGDFTPGRYVLQLTAIDRAARQTASQRVNFTVE
jgi:VWFA-related protein